MAFPSRRCGCTLAAIRVNWGPGGARDLSPFFSGGVSAACIRLAHFDESRLTGHRLQLEKKKLEYERLREHKRRFEAEIHKLDAQQRQEERELQQMAEDLQGGRFAGHQSEPTTPPEYRETSSGFPTMFSRPNRYSTSSLTSPPGLFNRPGRSGSQLASPQSGILQSRFAFDDQLPSRSVPGSRRNSDEDEKEEAVRQDPTSHRSTNAYVPASICLFCAFCSFWFFFVPCCESDSSVTVVSGPHDLCCFPLLPVFAFQYLDCVSLRPISALNELSSLSPYLNESNLSIRSFLLIHLVVALFTASCTIRALASP